ncbi:MAG: hypothetical protein KKD01_00465 [Proteobacteria bacterium]|nr:hypothetical protein [Pseudomonadota bacterium]MBU1231352.1 hypothetical protein [Pseudomonadota bacterium]MBU1417822.1 hypothetical protein [Pseudomonadota bacterium]MBU1453170.1 hypothetical protein [Pseudomonadota bacterium]
MQIDFHHATTYVAARIAGFDARRADIIAYAAQYVDDASSDGPVRFTNKFLYQRISPAHKMIDTRNTRDLDNHQVWIPFHFLPGNGGMEADRNPGGRVVNRLICTPDSPIARDMVRQTIVERDKPYGLHRLGVTMHVYADTWAHQGFAGLQDSVNEVEEAKETGNSDVFKSGLGDFIRNCLDDAIPPLGHGRATMFPDMPFLKWQYRNHNKELIELDNTEEFCRAANEMCKAMQRYLLGDPNAEADGINENDMKKIKQLFAETTEKDGNSRHNKWRKEISRGAFSFGPAEISYIGKSTKICDDDTSKSWKEQALGTNANLYKYQYKTSFLKSDWKLFHDAVRAHRFYIVNELLPAYGICAA